MFGLHAIAIKTANLDVNKHLSAVLVFRSVVSGVSELCRCVCVCDHTATTMSQLRSGRLHGLRGNLLRRYEHRPLVSCLAGLYGCKWRRYEWRSNRPGDCCCSKVRPASRIWFGRCPPARFTQSYQNKTDLNIKLDFQQIQCRTITCFC